VLEAADGLQTLHVARTQRPDLVLLDVMMPGKNGWEVAREMRNDPALADIGIVMLTAIGEKVNEMTSPLYGADDFVDKPFDFNDLEQKITRVIQNRRGANHPGGPGGHAGGGGAPSSGGHRKSK
jgi:DNA-binding response OmpR family regulator